MLPQNSKTASEPPGIVAAIYDIHGNLPALEAVLDEILHLDVDLVIVGGDVVQGPMPSESLELLRSIEIPTRFVMGNTDREVLAQMNNETTQWFQTAPNEWREPVAWSAQQLNEEQGRFLKS